MSISRLSVNPVSVCRLIDDFDHAAYVCATRAEQAQRASCDTQNMSIIIVSGMKSVIVAWVVENMWRAR